MNRNFRNIGVIRLRSLLSELEIRICKKQIKYLESLIEPYSGKPNISPYFYYCYIHKISAKHMNDRWQALTEEEKEKYSREAKIKFRDVKPETFPACIQAAIYLSNKLRKRLELRRNYYGQDISPKKPVNAYLQFLKEVREAQFKLLQKHEIDPQNLSYLEKLKKVGEIWNKMNENQKQKYYRLNELETIRYEEERETPEYLEKQRYIKELEEKLNQIKEQVKKEQ